jgi:uncharacterized protein (TIGR02646 family)
MRNILKGPAPSSLLAHRASAGAAFNNYQDKQGLRDSLVAEQRGLCAYCMSRIVADEKLMKVEHWQSQASFPERQLDYPNLLGVCLGGKGRAPKAQHCDTRKGDMVLSRNPSDAAHNVEQHIKYDPDGTIRSTDPVFDGELNSVLNLNKAPWLKENRKAALNAFLESKPREGEWNNRMLQGWLAQWAGSSGGGELNQYCQIVVYWIRKRLSRS